MIIGNGGERLNPRGLVDFGLDHVPIQSALVRELPLVLEKSPSAEIIHSFLGDLSLATPQLFQAGEWYMPDQAGPWTHRFRFKLPTEQGTQPEQSLAQPRYLSLFFSKFPTHIRVVFHDQESRQAETTVAGQVHKVPVLYGMSLRAEGQELTAEDFEAVGLAESQLTPQGSDKALQQTWWYRWFEAASF